MNKYYITGRVNGEVKGTSTIRARGEVEAWERFRRQYSRDDCELVEIRKAKPEDAPNEPRPGAGRSLRVATVGLLAGAGKLMPEIAVAHGVTESVLSHWLEDRGLGMKKLRRVFELHGVAGILELERTTTLEAAE